MNIRELDTVVLQHDLPEYHLGKGDHGAVVHMYSASCLEVEFPAEDGRTKALVTLDISDVQPLAVHSGTA